MKRLKTVPEEVLTTIEQEQTIIKSNLFRKYHVLCTLPVRPVRMRVHRSHEEKEEMEQVIVPATTIYIRQDGYVGTSLLDRDAITYSVTNCAKPFPYGHIYTGTGHVCLGNIFVPATISRFNPQQPLETLFLHNDRNLHHGNACLILNDKQVRHIEKLLEAYQIILSEDAQQSLTAGHNMLEDDGIWLLGADVYQQASDFELALHLMCDIYDCVFQAEKDTNKKGNI